MVKKEELKINFETTAADVKLDDLKLDLNNVRFQHFSKQISDKEMDKLIWDEPGTKELYEQIKSAKGLYEEPIIDSNNVVLEGNRRVVCLRKLRQKVIDGELQGFEKDAFKIIKCRMIPGHISDMDKSLLLATIHVKGKKQWPAFNKAKQIHDLYRTYNISYDNLAKYLGMGKITVIRMVKAYEQTYKYGQKYPDDKAWYRKYTYFDELFKKRDLQNFVKIQANIDKFAKWVRDGKFDDVRDIRALAQIMEDEDAMQRFETHGFKEAFELLQEKNPVLRSREFKQIQKTIETISSFPRKELIKTLTDPRRKKIIRKLKEEIDSLVRDIDALEKEE